MVPTRMWWQYYHRCVSLVTTPGGWFRHSTWLWLTLRREPATNRWTTQRTAKWTSLSTFSLDWAGLLGSWLKRRRMKSPMWNELAMTRWTDKFSQRWGGKSWIWALMKCKTEAHFVFVVFITRLVSYLQQWKWNKKVYIHVLLSTCIIKSYL